MAQKQIVHLFDLNLSIGHLFGNAFCGTTTGSLGDADSGIARQRVSIENGGLNPPAFGSSSTNGFLYITSPDNTRAYSYEGQSVEFPREATRESHTSPLNLKTASFLLASFDDINPVPRFEPSDRLYYAKQLPLRVGVTHYSPINACGTGGSCNGFTYILVPFLNPVTGVLVKNYDWDNGASGVAQIGFCFIVGRDVRNTRFSYMPLGWLENNKMINPRESDLTDTGFEVAGYQGEAGCYYYIPQSFPSNHEHYIYVDVLKSRQHSVRFVSKSSPELYDYRYYFTGDNDKIKQSFFPSVDYVFGIGFAMHMHNHENAVHRNDFLEFIWQDVHRL